MSPLYFVGSLGSRLPNPSGGWLLLTAHWLGALAAAGLIHGLSRRFSSMEKAETVRPEERTAGRVSLLAALPDSLRQVGSRAFWYCFSLTALEMPAAAEVAPDAFGGDEDVLREIGLDCVTELRRRSRKQTV